MYSDRSLTTLLRALQSGSDEQDISRLLGSAMTLLTLLSNPLNITLLTSQLLSAPSIWQHPDGLRTTLRILSIFNSAAIHLVSQGKSSEPPTFYPSRSTLSREEWAVAVIKGADEKSPRWRHLCVLAGLLTGLEGRGEEDISRSLRGTLESATVKAVNLALQEGEAANEYAANSMAVILSHVFGLLTDGAKLNLNHDLLLPILCHAPFFAREGLHSGYFLSTIDADILQSGGMQFDWSARSTTYVQCQRMATGPLIASLGSLSRLIAFSVENVQNVDLLFTMIKDLTDFTRSLCVQWRQNKLSEIDITEEPTFLSEQTRANTLPLLWRVMQSTMFATVIILQSLLGRVLRDVKIPVHGAPFMAIQTLESLRNLYFITSRHGANAFSQYTFAYLTAIDILSQYPIQAEAFLREYRPTSAGSIPQHPLDRCHDLYFLNMAEHFTVVLTAEFNEQILIAAATPYLGVGSDLRLLETFEAAHSVMLAVLSAPQNTDLLIRHAHVYVDALFKVFPQNLSARQFRMAVRTLIRITSPPSPISETEPLLLATLLELVRFRLQSASPKLLPHPISLNKDSGTPEHPALSEQTVLVLTLIDSLPFLHVDQLEDWLPLTAETLNTIQDAAQLQICRKRFWDVLSNGEMDVNRSALCVTWWGTRGGRDMVLLGREQQQEGPFMSGGLQELSRL